MDKNETVVAGRDLVQFWGWCMRLRKRGAALYPSRHDPEWEGLTRDQRDYLKYFRTRGQAHSNPPAALIRVAQVAAAMDRWAELAGLEARRAGLAEQADALAKAARVEIERLLLHHVRDGQAMSGFKSRGLLPALVIYGGSPRSQVEVLKSRYRAFCELVGEMVSEEDS